MSEQTLKTVKSKAEIRILKEDIEQIVFYEDYPDYWTDFGYDMPHNAQCAGDTIFFLGGDDKLIAFNDDARIYRVITEQYQIHTLKCMMVVDLFLVG